jgi:4-oxalocrotonate tautomerase
MPFINIKMMPGATAEQKAKLIKSITQLMVDQLGKDPKTTTVVIEEISPENWGSDGETIAARRKRGG